MSRPKLLDLFCGAGGAAKGYFEAGFDVVGVDHKPQPRFPFPFVKADALQYAQTHGHEFDVIHASPPCQKHSVTVNIHKLKKMAPKYEDMVTPTRIVLMLIGKPYVIENVIGAPVCSPVLLCGRMFGLKVLRHRLFETVPWILGPPHPKHPSGELTGACKGYSTGKHGYVCVAGNNFSPKAASKAMGIDWMKRDELAQAIPPGLYALDRQTTTKGHRNRLNGLTLPRRNTCHSNRNRRTTIPL